MVKLTMRRFALIFAFLAFSRASFADPLAETSAVEKSAEKPEAPMALAVNSPLSWVDGTSIAGSLYARVAPHQAVRISVASYEDGASAAIVAGLLGQEDESSHDGRILDVSAGWMYFPRRLWDGPTLEAGVLRRSGSTSVRDELADNELVERDTQLYAMRALAGWSWHVENVMVSFAAGASSGYQTGTETDTMSVGRTPAVTRDVSGWKTGFEGYVRFGLTFGN